MQAFDGSVLPRREVLLFGGVVERGRELLDGLKVVKVNDFSQASVVHDVYEV